MVLYSLALGNTHQFVPVIPFPDDPVLAVGYPFENRGKGEYGVFNTLVFLDSPQINQSLGPVSDRNGARLVENVIHAAVNDPDMVGRQSAPHQIVAGRLGQYREHAPL